MARKAKTKKVKNLMQMPVQQNPCNTCPFAGKKALQLDPISYAGYLQNLNEGGQHLCHSADNKIICRGGRDIQLRIFFAKGMIEFPTDESLNEAYQKYSTND